MTTLALITSDPETTATIRSILPNGWRLEERLSPEDAVELLELAHPDLIVVDMDLEGYSAPAFVRALRGERNAPPPVFLLVRETLTEARKAEARVLQPLQVLLKPLDPDVVLKVLHAHGGAGAYGPMTLIEHLAAGYTDLSHRQVRLKSGSQTLSLVLGNGYVWALFHPLFYHQYSVALAQAGFAVGAAAPSDAVGLAALEEGLGPPSAELLALKRQTLLAAFASLALGSDFEAMVEDEAIPEGLIPLDVPPLVVSLVDHVPEGSLGVLKRSGLRVAARSSVIPEDLPILPHHGYLLSQCGQGRVVADLLQTNILPERQVLSGLYVLLLLDLLKAEPEPRGPFSLTGLRAVMEDEEVRVRRQSEAIRNLVQAFEIPGGNPYQILGVSSDATPVQAKRAFETVLERLNPDRLHPEVLRTHQKDLLLLRAKLNESLLILQSSYMSDEQARRQSLREGAEGGDSKAASARVGPGSEAGKREAGKLLAKAKAVMEEDGQPYDALQLVNLALFHDPGLAEGHNFLAKILERKPGQKAQYQVQAEYLKAIELAPKNIDYILDLADFFLRAGQLARCRSYLDKVWYLDSRNERRRALFQAYKARQEA